MATNNKYTAPIGRCIVEKVTCQRVRPDELSYPTPEHLASLGYDQEWLRVDLWRVLITLRRGYEETYSQREFFEHEENARSRVQEIKNGDVFDDESQDFLEIFKNFEFASLAIFELLSSVQTSGQYVVIDEVLCGAQLIDEHGRKTSNNVLEWAGAARIENAQSLSELDWEILIRLEYCFHHYPISSLAFLAAKYEFRATILRDEFGAGYLLRQIESSLAGYANLAEDTWLARQKAGVGGRKASQEKRKQRLVLFINEIEALSDIVGKVSEQAILDQAFQNAIAAEPSLWKQGRGQQAEYETALRSEIEFRQRYFAVFGKTA